MPRLLMLSALCALASVAMAQPQQQRAAGVPGEEIQIDRGHRRAELRTALQINRQQDVPPAAELPIAQGRHLTPNERAEMREQLRQQPGASRRSPQ